MDVSKSAWVNAWKGYNVILIKTKMFYETIKISNGVVDLREYVLRNYKYSKTSISNPQIRMFNKCLLKLL